MDRSCWPAYPPRAQSAGNYDFTTVVDSSVFGAGSQTSLLNGGQAGFDFNNAGTAVFGVQLPSGQTRIYTGDGGPLNLVASDTNVGTNPIAPYTILSSFGNSINDAGVVAYWEEAVPPSGPVTEGIYTSGGITIVATNNEGSYPDEFTSINDSGVVAFVATGSKIVTGSGGATTTIFTGPETNLTSINNAGTVAFRPQGAPDTIYTGNGGTPTAIYSGFPIDFRMNNAGTVAFDISGGGVLTGNGASPATLYVAGAFYPSINDLGQVAYYYQAGAADLGSISIGLNPIAGKVIEIGDPLDGSTVTSLSFSKINNLGQVAFGAGLANGETGLFIATPVPEPTTAALAGAALISLLLVTGRHRRRSDPTASLPAT